VSSSRTREATGTFDGLSGTFCANLGHGNIRIANAAHEQMRRLAMAGPTLATNGPRLGACPPTPRPPARRLLGREALLRGIRGHRGGDHDCAAVSQADRRASEVQGLVSLPLISRCYRLRHGCLGLASMANALRTAGAWLRAPSHPGTLSSPLDGNETTLGRAYARLIEETIEFEDPRTIAALITEPILTSAGAVVPPPDYLPALRELCDRNNILLIFDEIITGFGRVGDLFAAHLFDTWPDIFCFGKGMSGGYAPLSAVVMTDKVAAPFWGRTLRSPTRDVTSLRFPAVE
jgi:adenosylmethionine-8-amino-7-oxononanoate aminotransferase